MKRWKKAAICLLTLVAMVGMIMMTTYAAGTYHCEVTASTVPAIMGQEVRLTVRLTDYTEEKSGIRGFQIDISNVDDVLSSSVCASLVEDSGDILSNVAGYQDSRDVVRQTYVKRTGTLPYETADLMQMTITVPKTYESAGTLTLPLVLLIQNEAGEQLTISDTVEISYEPLRGDINDDGKVNNRDAARLMQYLAGWDVIYMNAALDVNGDGNFNNRDAARLMQYLAGWDVTLDCTRGK